MSQNNAPILHVGLDVAKLSLQLHLKERFHSLGNDPKGHAQLLKLLRAHPGCHVVCEATGGYEQPVVRALHAAAIPLSVLEAGRVRHFARASGQRAKTDPIDAAVLTAYGVALRPPPTAPLSIQQQRLADLAQRRRQLIESLISERNRSAHYTQAVCRAQAAQLLRLLQKQIRHCDEAIAELIAQDSALAHKARRLQTITGVGPTVAATVLAEMPELGTLKDKSASALAGVAPYNHDSGAHRGQRHISGGRRSVRCALYMACLSAVRYDPILKTFYQRLRAAGKKPLLAMTACMRKLIVLMNRLLKNDNFTLAT